MLYSAELFLRYAQIAPNHDCALYGSAQNQHIFANISANSKRNSKIFYGGVD
jgi:hypothetical protein